MRSPEPLPDTSDSYLLCCSLLEEAQDLAKFCGGTPFSVKDKQKTYSFQLGTLESPYFSMWEMRQKDPVVLLKCLECFTEVGRSLWNADCQGRWGSNCLLLSWHPSDHQQSWKDISIFPQLAGQWMAVILQRYKGISTCQKRVFY